MLVAPHRSMVTGAAADLWPGRDEGAIERCMSSSVFVFLLRG